MTLSERISTKQPAIYTLICILAFAYFCTLVLFEIPQTAFYYDSGIHIDAAKMFAYGLGKPITPYTYELFSTLTSGPTLVWFGAVIARLLGSSIWIAGFSAAGLNLTLLAILFWRLYKIAGKSCLPIFLCLCLVFLLQNIQWWVIFIGDISSLLLFLITATLAVDQNLSEKKRHTYSAITATLSLYARLTSLPLISGLIAYLLIRQIFLILERKSTPTKCVYLFFISFCVFLTITIFIKSIEYSFFFLSHEFSYANFLSDRLGFLSGNSTLGIGALIKSPNTLDQITHNMSSNFNILAESFRGKMGIESTFSLLLASIALPLLRIPKQKNTLDFLIFSLFPALLLISIWFFALANIVFDRYTMQISFMMLILIFLSFYRFSSWFGIIFLATVVFILAPPAEKIKLKETLLLREKTDKETLLAKKNNKELEDAANFLTAHQEKKPLAKCGWMSSAWPIHYLLPPEYDFSDCYKIIRNSLKFDEEFYLQNNPKASAEIANTTTSSAEAHFLASDRKSPVRYQWISPVNFTLVIHKSSWQFSKFNKSVRSVQKSLQDACKPTTLFNNDSVRIMDCTFDNLQQHIATDQLSLFVDDTPYWKR